VGEDLSQEIAQGGGIGAAPIGANPAAGESPGEPGIPGEAGGAPNQPTEDHFPVGKFVYLKVQVHPPDREVSPNCKVYTSGVVPFTEPYPEVHFEDWTAPRYKQTAFQKLEKDFQTDACGRVTIIARKFPDGGCKSFLYLKATRGDENSGEALMLRCPQGDEEDLEPVELHLIGIPTYPDIPPKGPNPGNPGGGGSPWEDGGILRPK